MIRSRIYPIGSRYPNKRKAYSVDNFRTLLWRLNPRTNWLNMGKSIKKMTKIEFRLSLYLRYHLLMILQMRDHHRTLDMSNILCLQFGLPQHGRTTSEQCGTVERSKNQKQTSHSPLALSLAWSEAWSRWYDRDKQVIDATPGIPGPKTPPRPTLTTLHVTIQRAWTMAICFWTPCPGVTSWSSLSLSLSTSSSSPRPVPVKSHRQIITT